MNNNTYYTTTDYENLAIHHLEGYTPEILWNCLAYWQYEKLRTEGYLYTCEDEASFGPFSLKVVNRKIDWYATLLMRWYGNA